MRKPTPGFNDQRFVTSVGDSPNPDTIIHGRVNADGTIARGKGFTVSHPSTGSYTITFNPPFIEIPAFIPAANLATFAVGNNCTVSSGALSTSSASVTIVVNSALTDRAFEFIAIGQRS